jgi:uncharacterized protein
MISKSSIAPFVAPFVVFMLFLSIVDAYWPNEHYLLYPVKSLLVAGVIAWYWRELPSLKPVAPVASVAIGVLGLVLWVGMEPLANGLAEVMGAYWNHFFGSGKLVAPPPAGLDPFALYPAAEAWTLFACRVAGIALVVPVMEELFWRGFLMRWLIREDFTAVPLGTYQSLSFAVTTVFFASVHGTEWPQGLVVGVIYGAWFVRTKSLGSIMLAHGVTNLLLAFYCLATGQWHFLATLPK